MEREIVFKRVNEVCRDVFDDENLIVSDNTTADDVEGWDSLTHLSLVSELENMFNIRFTMGEIQKSRNLGELVDVIMKRMNDK